MIFNRVKKFFKGSSRVAERQPLLSELVSPHLALYDSRPPAPMNAFSLFEEKWASTVPGVPHLQTGATLFDDDRIKGLLGELGDLNGRSVLELGPLEGGHTFMLERAGAEVTAIEANIEAFLKCLVIKNHFGLRSTFLLGDFFESFGDDQKWDLIVASGVLYHQIDPVSLLVKISDHADTAFFWTHYYEPDLTKWDSNILLTRLEKFDPNELRYFNLNGKQIRGVRYMYKEASHSAGFCGGPQTESTWLFKSDLLDALHILGYQTKISFDVPDHVNGPSMCILAQRGDNHLNLS